ncbi:hypothetical protein, partial [Legionella santicrucis]|uniref:hypothetical protein n=1 Tax=Legionella santicrucis TaxID=45074 RepID=UPI001ED9937C
CRGQAAARRRQVKCQQTLVNMFSFNVMRSFVGGCTLHGYNGSIYLPHKKHFQGMRRIFDDFIFIKSSCNDTKS